MVSRSIPPTLASLLERLELDRPTTVTLQQLEVIASECGLETPARILAHRLKERGWLLKTPVAGVWEFAPADRAGPFSDADPLLTLRAALARAELPVAVALASALWLHNLSARAPDRHEIAIPSGTHVPRALRDNYRVIRHQANLEPQSVTGLPVHRPAAVLIHLAHRPTDVRSWGAMLEVLPDLLAACTLDQIRIELRGRPHTTHVRLVYLLQALAPDLVEALDVTPAGKVWFGPRRTLRRHDAQWNVADTILPFSPRDLVPHQ